MRPCLHAPLRLYASVRPGRFQWPSLLPCSLSLSLCLSLARPSVRLSVCLSVWWPCRWSVVAPWQELLFGLPRIIHLAAVLHLFPFRLAY